MTVSNLRHEVAGHLPMEVTTHPSRYSNLLLAKLSSIPSSDFNHMLSCPWGSTSLYSNLNTVFHLFPTNLPSYLARTCTGFRDLNYPLKGSSSGKLSCPDYTFCKHNLLSSWVIRPVIFGWIINHNFILNKIVTPLLLSAAIAVHLVTTSIMPLAR